MRNYKLKERFSRQHINSCLDHLAEQINKDYQGKNLVLIGILNGAFIFMAYLARRIDVPVKIDFVRLASYGEKTESCGTISITKDIEIPLQGSHVLVVEDIIDSGFTLKWLIDHISHMCPESVKVCAMINKLERREVEVSLDYVGITVDSGFLVGYGLDFSENHRNLAAIYEVVFD